MKYLVLSVITLVMCSGCLSKICVEEIQEQGVVQTHIDLSESVTGGLTKDRKTIVLEDSNNNKFRFDKISGKRYRVQGMGIPTVCIKLPVYGLDKEPADDEDAYISIKEKDDIYLIFDLKRSGKEPEEVVVKLQKNTDPHYLKRSGLVLATPVAVGVDAVLLATGVGLVLGFGTLALLSH